LIFKALLKNHLVELIGEEEMNNRVMLVGCGPHATRIYLPTIDIYREEFNIDLAAVVDIESKKQKVTSVIANKHPSADLHFVTENSDGIFQLSPSDKDKLERIVEEREINSMILSTDPLAHKAYIEFALEKGIHILMDKPITTQPDASTNITNAKGIMEDYYGLIKKFREAEIDHPDLIVSCLSQRRYHPAINRVKEELERVYDLTGCPPTSIVCQHSDGQWRMPNEIIDIPYHGYDKGIGKGSHSGYHFFDIMNWYAEVAKGKQADKIECFANFVRPADWINQFTLRDYEKLFGKQQAKDMIPFSQDEFETITHEFGEIDAHINFTYKKDNKTITNIQMSLLHGGFSKRSWSQPKQDLYKGNGRIRHETHIIHQGPFQALYYVSYQSDEISNRNLKDRTDVGGELHSDVYIFRNSKALRTDLPPLEIIPFGKSTEDGLHGYSRGHQENARVECFVEFMRAIEGNIPKGALKSSLEKHEGSVKLMALSYLSAAKEFNGEGPFSYYSNGELK